MEGLGGVWVWEGPSTLSVGGGPKEVLCCVGL